MSSLRIEILCSYFDGKLNRIFLTLTKTAIIHNWRHFHSLSSVLKAFLSGGPCRSGSGSCSCPKISSQGLFQLKLYPTYKREDTWIPFQGWSGTDLVQPLHVLVKGTKVQRGPGTCSKTSSKSWAELGIEVWGPALSFSRWGCYHTQPSGSQGGRRVGLRYLHHGFVSPLLFIRNIWTHLGLLRDPFSQMVWRKKDSTLHAVVTTVSLFGERYIDRWSPILHPPWLPALRENI